MNKDLLNTVLFIDLQSPFFVTLVSLLITIFTSVFAIFIFIQETSFLIPLILPSLNFTPPIIFLIYFYSFHFFLYIHCRLYICLASV